MKPCATKAKKKFTLGKTTCSVVGFQCNVVAQPIPAGSNTAIGEEIRWDANDDA